MPLLLKNNAFSLLASSLTDTGTTLTVTTGHGNRFPIASSPDYFKLTLQDAANNIEVLKVTARANNSDSMTIVRAQEGTTARAWNIGDLVELRLTSGVLAPLALMSEASTAADIRTAIGAFASSGGSIAGDVDITGSLVHTGNYSYTGTLTGGTGVINIGSGQLYKSTGGFVGFGTTSPLAKSHSNIITSSAFTTSASLIGGANADLAAYYCTNNGSAANGTEVGMVLDAGSSQSAQYGIYVQKTNAHVGALIFRRRTGSTAAAEFMRIDEAGHFGLNTVPSTWGAGIRALETNASWYLAANGNQVNLAQNVTFNGSSFVYKNTGLCGLYRIDQGEHLWGVASSGSAGATASLATVLKITNSGNLLVGSGADEIGGFKLKVHGTSTQIGITYPSIATWSIGVDSSGNFKIFKDGSERFRVSSNGFAKFSNNGTFDFSGNDRYEFNSNLDTAACSFKSSNIGSSTVVFETHLNSGAGGRHIAAQLNGFAVMQVLANGNVQNTNNSYGAISDARLKDILGDAPSYIDKYMLVRYVIYRLKGSTQKQFGVIAQELEKIFPGLVEEVPVFDAKGKATGDTQKTVKYSVLAQIQGKVIQEQQAIIQSIMERVSRLEAR